MNFKKINKFRRNVRAISPVIATLLMIAIAVVASLVVYAWVMGYMNFTTSKTGKAIIVQSVAPVTGGGFNIYVQNTGDSSVSFALDQGVYVNGTLIRGGVATGTGVVTAAAGLTNGNLPASSTGTLFATVTNWLAPAHGDNALIKLTTTDGTQTQFTWYVP
jgi:flagellin-like protein